MVRKVRELAQRLLLRTHAQVHVHEGREHDGARRDAEQEARASFARFTADALAGLPITIYGDGRHARQVLGVFATQDQIANSPGVHLAFASASPAPLRTALDRALVRAAGNLRPLTAAEYDGLRGFISMDVAAGPDSTGYCKAERRRVERAGGVADVIEFTPLAEAEAFPLMYGIQAARRRDGHSVHPSDTQPGVGDAEIRHGCIRDACRDLGPCSDAMTCPALQREYERQHQCRLAYLESISSHFCNMLEPVLRGDCNRNGNLK